jgi:ribosomal protein L29
MDLQKIHVDELKDLDVTRLNQTAKEIREKIFETRMDIYKPSGMNSGKLRGLRRSLARVLTVKTKVMKASKAK